MDGISGFDLTVVIAELSRIIKGSRINKIYQVNPKTVLIKLRGQGETFNLLIEAGKRIHLTVYEVERPREPPSFCMVLRKYLENGVIEDISQYDLERIVELHVKRGDQKYRLIAELFEKGNIILVDSENRILHALSYRRMRDRSVLRGEEYKYPPQRGIDPKKAGLEDLYRLRDFSGIESVRGLTRLLGISGSYAEEILFRSSVDKTKPCSSLSDEEIKAIFSSVNEILYKIDAGSYKPCIIVDGNGNWIDVAPFPLEKYSIFSVIEMETFNRALDEYYMRITYQERARSIEEKARQKMARLEKILEEQRRNLRELEEEACTYRQIGDTIYSHLHELNLLIERVMHEKRSGRGWKDIARKLLEEKEGGVAPSTYFVSLNPSTLTLKVSVNGQLFDLSLKASAQERANEYYKRAKKLEDKVKGVKRAIEETIKEIEEVKSEADKSAEETLPPRPIIRREWYEKFRWFHSSGGFLVIGGRDASTNEVLIRKYMMEDDIVFHADIPGSPFTLIKTGGKQPDEETIFEAAQFTASYSRAWREQIRVIDVYWVKPEQVSKASPSGQYLPKGSFIIYGTRNYIRNVPLEVAIGIKREDDNIRVIGGPVSAISKQTNLYVKIVPGNTPSGRLAKAIKEKMASMAPMDERKIILKIPLENIQAFIPLGQGALLEPY
ncbi:MAG: ribosome rescue protein RqcH [Candidatus Bathyarchaeia archaeon]